MTTFVRSEAFEKNGKSKKYRKDTYLLDESLL